MATKEKQVLYAKKHYVNNKETMKRRAINYNKIAKERNRKFVEDYLINHPCTDCEENDIIVLEFDHVNGDKIANISDAIKNGWSIEKIKNEIEKCVVRCANCHRRITHKRRNEIGTTDTCSISSSNSFDGHSNHGDLV